MSDATRREMLQRIAAAVLAGPVSAEAADHVHKAVAGTLGGAAAYQPKALNAHEFATLHKLCELIIPGASKGQAAEFVDLLSSQSPEMAEIYTGGLAWLDRAMERIVNATFLAARPADQIALLDKIAYRRNATPEWAPGVRFFDWARRMTADSYYTSAAGIQELGYMGNKGMTEFKVPQAAIDYAVKRSGLA